MINIGGEEFNFNENSDAALLPKRLAISIGEPFGVSYR